MNLKTHENAYKGLKDFTKNLGIKKEKIEKKDK